MKILLSPAKSIHQDKTYENLFSTEIVFKNETNSLAKKLQKLSVKKMEKLMHISSELALLNVQRYADWTEEINKNTASFPAIYGFNGEVYKGFEADTLSEKQLLYAQENVRILSGLYGILKPLDLIAPYRLEMGTKWNITPKTKNLYQFWDKKITAYLNNELKKNEPIINLASTEYFKAVDVKSLNARVITPVFKEFKNGDYKIIMMFAKHARGAMARYIVNNELIDPEEIKLFSQDGYGFDHNLSSENEWVFTR
ncbi:MAG: hypothetical protein RIT10_1825 [Bacteroidota bacterium]|jgi:cytoplasmic iron level regulating protein YaaA (DUF328/UPF0246 family)